MKSLRSEVIELPRGTGHFGLVAVWYLKMTCLVKVFPLKIAPMSDIGVSVWDGVNEPVDIDSGGFVIVNDAEDHY